ncbi:hypothetical protein COL154_014315 [Colletotrichum chrysophilum]|nr:hypothetical protein COL154_014315 [Colletotrichum chrysophilum]
MEGTRMAKTTATLALVERIAQDVQAGRFAPGMWLKQIDMQERYGKNRSDIRRALEALAHKRLLQYVPNKGYYVYQADDERTAEILQIRIMLETSAAGLITGNATPVAIEDLRRLAGTFDRLISTGTIVEIYEANLAFHKALLTLSGNRQLVELVDEVRLKTSPAPTSQWSRRIRIEQSSREHFEMVEAVSSGDSIRLRQVVQAHIEQSALDRDK